MPILKKKGITPQQIAKKQDRLKKKQKKYGDKVLSRDKKQREKMGY
jgi:hypothetical protein